MKQRLKKLVIWGALICLILFSLAYAFSSKLEKMIGHWMERETQASISRYGANLPPVDEVRVLQIDDTPSGQGFGAYHFPFYYDLPDMTIVSEKTVVGEEAQKVANLWRAMRLRTDFMALCYKPHHVIQFRAHGSVVCEAVPCFLCGNTTLTGFPVNVKVSFDSRPKQESRQYLEFKNIIEILVGKHIDPPPVTKKIKE